ncbi:MAG: DUF4249 domain-containing protein [Salinivirgaceae bacterium]|jgi:hypothetical protein|nr:DUF4249 domain-containing protein [Salinivirgaceae bacterium]
MKQKQIIKHTVLVLFILGTLSSCIDVYELEGDGYVKSVVVDALITDDKEEQIIYLTHSSFAKDPNLRPISKADVVVIDKGGNIFEFNELSAHKGAYIGIIPFDFLVFGNAFKISFTTVSGKEYESAFEELQACPPIDSIYYEINNEYYPQNSDESERGVEFFLDVKANEQYSRYYRWLIEETYEYHATWPMYKFMAAWIRSRIAPDYKWFTCYKTNKIFTLSLASTSHLDENVYLKYPLLFVNNQTQRLYFRYSVLVKQMSISKSAYDYWESLRSNNQTSGGLFDSQPQKTRGNIVCLSNPDETPLGYFNVSSIQTKRLSINVDDINRELIYDHDVWCVARFLPPESTFLDDLSREQWPFYLPPTPEDGDPGGTYVADQSCFDCRLSGGILEEPEFWKNK